MHLEERTPERVWEMVSKGRLAAGITRPVSGQEPLGMRTLPLRDEVLGIAVPPGHPLAGRWSGGRRWRPSLVVLARREGMNLHDTLLAGCRQAFPAGAYASLIGTVLLYAEAGAGVAVVTESVVSPGEGLQFVPLTPRMTVPLVFAWNKAARRWNASGNCWSPGGRRGRCGGGGRAAADDGPPVRST